MSKSSGQAITLSASDSEIAAAVRLMYTDPDHLRASDPGRVEGNVVFTYLDTFDPDGDVVTDLKAHYRRGGLGDIVLKKRLSAILQQLIAPIRERRAVLSQDRESVMDILRTGTARARLITQQTKDEVFDALGLFSLR